MNTTLWSAAAAWAALSVSAACGQGVTLDEANSRAFLEIKVPNPELLNHPEWTSTAPISFDLAVAGLAYEGSVAEYSATRIVQQDQTITQLRIEPFMVADGTQPTQDPSFANAYSRVDLLARFTTPVPGPAFFLSGGIAAQLAGDPMSPGLFVPRFQMFVAITKASNGQVVWSSNVQCPGNTSCVLLDTGLGFITGSLQGGETYDLRVAVIGASKPGSFSSAVGPPMVAEPFVQIDFGQSFDRLCADQNQDGQITPADFNTWVLNYNSNSLLADVNQDSVLTPSDFNAWILAYNLGLAGPYCVP